MKLKFVKGVLAIFSSLDFFQQNISLKLQDSFRVLLTIGKLFSFFIVGLLLYNFIESDMIQKTNPIVLQQSFENDQRLTINFTSNDILMAFGIIDDYNKIYDDPSIFSITARKGYVLNGSNYTFTSGKMEYCSHSHFSKYSDVFSDLYLNGTQCLSDNFILKGFWDEPLLQYIEFEVKKCSNSSSNPVICKSDQEIKAYMQGKYFSQWIEQKRYNMKEFENPISGKIKNYYVAYQAGVSRATRFFIKKVNVITEKGFLFSETKKDESWAVDRWEYDSTTHDDQQLFKFVVYASDFSFSIERRYQKLYDLFAALGGLLQGFLFIGSILVKKTHDWKLSELILNELFVFKGVKIINKVVNRSLFSTIKSFTLGSMSNISSREVINELKFFTLGNMSNISPRELVNEFSKKNVQLEEKLTMNLKEKLGLFFKNKSKWNRKEKTYNEYMKKSNAKIDLLNLVKKLEEIEKIKLILFNEKQLVFFDSICRKKVNLNKGLHKYKFELNMKNKNPTQIKVLQDFLRDKKLYGSTSFEKKMIELVNS